MISSLIKSDIIPFVFQELATHIGEVVINKCFCTRRNPISISAAAIYLACQLEDKRKTQAEICKVTGLTEVTLRKVYKELLENWDDLLPSNYIPAVPPERAFPTTVIASGRTSATKVDLVEAIALDREKQPEAKPNNKPNEVTDMIHQARIKEDIESKGNARGAHNPSLNRSTIIWQTQLPLGTSGLRIAGDKSQNIVQGMEIDEAQSNNQQLEQQIEKETKGITDSSKQTQLSSPLASSSSLATRQFRPPSPLGPSPSVQYLQPPKLGPGYTELKGSGGQNGNKNAKYLFGDT